MEIRPCNLTDERDRAALWRLKREFEVSLAADPDKRATYEGKLTDEYREQYLAWVERCLDSEPRSVLLAEAGDSTADSETEAEIVGYAFVLPERLAMIWDAAVLNEIFVAPDYRGTGLGDDLLEAVLSVARDQSLPLDRIVLDVDRDNPRAQAFYERHGFEHWGEMVARTLSE